MQHGYSSEGETVYSAETAESRIYTSPREGKFQLVGQSQSCVIYNRSGIVERNSVAQGTLLENQKALSMEGRCVHKWQLLKGAMTISA